MSKKETPTVEELERFFTGLNMENNFQLTKCQIVHNLTKFAQSHLEVIKANSGNKTFKPYYDRLVDLKKMIEEKND